jgi:hypothetical protein
MENDDMDKAIDKKKHNGTGKDCYTQWPMLHPERFHQHIADNHDRRNVQIELVVVALLQQIHERE